KGTLTSCPAFFAAASIAAHPPRTIRSASETLVLPFCEPSKAFWIASSFPRTVLSWAGWLTSQSFCGAKRIRAPFAPPPLSETGKVDDDAQAVETSCETERPDARIFALRAEMSLGPISG